MITSGEVLLDLESTLKKVELLQVTFPRNDLWPKINNNLKEIILLIKKDRKLFGYE